MNKQTFSKAERLCNKTIIDSLFEKGSTITQTYYLFPFKVFYVCQPTFISPTQVLFSVSKRNFKKAVTRNLIRRRCREAYRLNKVLFDEKSPQLAPSYIGFVYIAKEEMAFSKIESAMKAILPKLIT